MKIFLMILIIFMAQGCRTYGVEKGVDAAGNEYVKVDISSSADLENPSTYYEKNADGSVKFTFAADNVDNNTEAFLGIFEGIAGMFNQMMEGMMAMQLQMLTSQQPQP